MATIPSDYQAFLTICHHSLLLPTLAHPFIQLNNNPNISNMCTSFPTIVLFLFIMSNHYSQFTTIPNNFQRFPTNSQTYTSFTTLPHHFTPFLITSLAPLATISHHTLPLHNMPLYWVSHSTQFPLTIAHNFSKFTHQSPPLHPIPYNIIIPNNYQLLPTTSQDVLPFPYHFLKCCHHSPLFLSSSNQSLPLPTMAQPFPQFPTWYHSLTFPTYAHHSKSLLIIPKITDNLLQSLIISNDSHPVPTTAHHLPQFHTTSFIPKKINMFCTIAYHFP